MKRVVSFFSLPWIALVAGCNPATNDVDEGPPKPKVVAFEGQVEPRYVGNWKTANGTSFLELHKDGSAVISSSIPGPKGISKTKLEGKWLVSGSDLLFNYRVGSQPEITVKYPAKLSDTEMDLDQGSRSKMVYKRV